MEQASMTTENLRNTMATVDAMKVANKELKKQYGKIDIDKIESIHYDMEDLLESANEIQATMGRSYGVPDELDEADLQAELDALEDDLAFESIQGNTNHDEAIPSYLRDDMNEPLPDLVDPTSEDVRS
jgi:charged multivesicular body protein 5